MSTVSGKVGSAPTAANYTGDSGGNLLITGATPSAPAAGKIALSAVSVGGRMTPSVTPPVGALYALEPSVGQCSIYEWNTIPNTTSAPTGVGSAAPTSASTTATARTVATGSVFTRAKRWGSVTNVSTAGASTSLRGIAVFCLEAGFHYVSRWGISDAAAVANGRLFVGFAALTTAIGNVEPSTLVNMFGVGCEAGQTTMRTYSNDGSGTATMADLGANFPTNTQSVDWYELAMFCAVGGSTVYYTVTRLNTGDVATGSWSSDLPASTTLLVPHIWRNNGSTALAAAFDFQRLRIRTDT